MPLVTSWIGHHPIHAQLAAAYGLVGLGSAVSYWILARRVIRANGDSSVVARAVGKDIKGNVSLVFYMAGTCQAFAAPRGVLGHLCLGRAAVVRPDRRLAPLEESRLIGLVGRMHSAVGGPVGGRPADECTVKERELPAEAA